MNEILLDNYKAYHIFLFWLLISPVFGWGQETLSITKEGLKNGLSLKNYGEYVIANTHQSWETIDSTAFRPLSGLSFSTDAAFSVYTETQNAYWIRFRLENTITDSVYALMKVGVFDSLMLYKEDIHLPIFTAGLLAEISQADFPNADYLKTKYGVPIQLAANETTTYYLRIKNIFRFEEETANLILYQAKDEATKRSRELFPFFLLHGLFFGLVLFLMLFFGVQYLQNRDITYAYYLLYLACIFFYFLWKFEKSNSVINILTLFHPEWYYYYEVPNSVILFIAYSSFVLHFMDVKEAKPKIYRFVQHFFILCLVYLVVIMLISIFWGFGISGVLHVFGRIVSLYPSIYAGYHLFGLNNRLFSYILIGTTILIIGSSITMTLSANLATHYQGPWDIPLIPGRIGILIEILFFSLGLGYKSRMIQLEKNKTQEKLIHQMQKNEQLQLQAQSKLEAEIEKKTLELNIKNEELMKQREAQLISSYNEQLIESELKALKAQLNPHFIFNCLMAIKNLIGRGESDLAEKYLITFSKVMRSALTYSEIESATLSDELNISENYIQMEAMRFRHQFSYDFDIEEGIDLYQINIPPLVLQPHLENAIKHGLLPKKGEKNLKVTVKRLNEYILCIIDDDGVGRKLPTTKPKDSGDGMRISAQRLDLFNQKFSKKLSLEIIDKQDEKGIPLGTQVILHIPNTQQL